MKGESFRSTSDFSLSWIFETLPYLPLEEFSVYQWIFETTSMQMYLLALRG